MKRNWDVFNAVKQAFWDKQEQYKEEYKFTEMGAIFFSAYDMMNAHVEPFDMNASAEKMVQTHTKPTDKYFGMSKEQIIEQWTTKNDKSKQTGNGLDDYITALWNGKPLPPVSSLLDEASFKREVLLRNQADIFYDKMSQNKDIEFVGAGVWCNSTPYGFRGIMDKLLYNNKTGTLLILDSKQNEHIETEKNYGKYMTGCLSTVPYTDLNKLSLQLYGYRYAIEDIGFEVGATALIHYKEDSFNMLRPQFAYDKLLMEHIFHASRQYKVNKIKQSQEIKSPVNDSAISEDERSKLQRF